MRGVGHKLLRNTSGHKKTTVEVAKAETQAEMMKKECI